MFTGIVEFIGEITDIQTEGTNRHFDIKAPFDEPIKIDQSISHNGACLTVADIHEQDSGKAHYRVTAIAETLSKTHLNTWDIGHKVNLERSMRINGRLDGHFVQGHVDSVGTVIEVLDLNGSWKYTVEFDPSFQHLVVPKGSICINGVSLTVVDCEGPQLSVAIIPFTYEHTSFHTLKKGDLVNLEFDILGKYLDKLMAVRNGN